MKNTDIDGIKSAITEIAKASPAFVAENLTFFNDIADKAGMQHQLVVAGTITYQITASIRVISDADWVLETLINDGFDKPAVADGLRYFISPKQTVTMRMTVLVSEINGENPMDYFVENYEGNEYNQADDSRIEITQVLKVVELSRDRQFHWRIVTL